MEPRPIKDLIPASSLTPKPTPVSPTSNWRPTLDDYEPSLKRAADLCAKFVADIEAGLPAYWLTLGGKQGVGKTMLMGQLFEFAKKYAQPATEGWPMQTGIYDERRRRPSVRWIDETRFTHLFLTDKQYDLPEYIAHEWLVAYDDLGSKTIDKGVLADAIFRLANQRLGRWTIWTTNFTLEDIALRIDPRVSSRLIRDNNRLVTITAPDYGLRRRS